MHANLDHSARITSASSPPTLASLSLIRHAEVEQKYQRVFGGRIDMELSLNGHWQSARLSEYLRGQPIDAVYASPMTRVRQTLQPMLGNGIPEPVITPDFREVDFGDWTGHSWEEVQEKFGVSPFVWLHQLDGDCIRNAESAARLRQRVEPALEAVLRNHAGQNVAIICHGGVIRMMLSMLLGLPFTRMSMFEIEYASLTRLLFQRGEPQLHLLNFSPWRDIK
jgi:broad specificity phosphatase PhoE